MKKIACALLALILGSAALKAETPVYRIDLQVAKVPAAHLNLCRERVQEGEQWQRHIESGQVQIIESATLLGSENQDSELLQGHKVPVIYNDPRAQGSQVNYFDAGLKLNVRAVPSSQGQVKLDCNLERSALNQPGQVFQGLNIFRTFSVVNLKPGQVGLIASTRGVLSARSFKKVFPGQVFGEKDTLLLAVRLRR